MSIFLNLFQLKNFSIVEVLDSNIYETPTTSTSLSSVTRKKSVLKVRQPTIEKNDANESAVSSPASSNDLILNSQNPCSLPKRNVTFRDGVRPGDDASDSGRGSRSSDGNEQNSDELHRVKKVYYF